MKFTKISLHPMYISMYIPMYIYIYVVVQIRENMNKISVTNSTQL